VRLYDVAQVMRSKNAGPFTLTIDLMFATHEEFERVLNASGFTPEGVGQMYGVDATRVRIVPFERVLTIKVSMPRTGASSGAPGDTDVYGCGQHFPLGELGV